MSEEATLRAVPTPARPARRQPDWAPSSAQIVIGKDVLELLSTSMYVDPMTIYREYVQNAADAVDEARASGLLESTARGEVEIVIDPLVRSIRIRDNGTGVPVRQFEERLSNLGASTKRGTTARGFRGVGRLAGLGYCQELIFRSRAEGEQVVSELRWDCRALKSALRAMTPDLHLVALVREIVSYRRVSAERLPSRFFEVELRNVVRHRNDRLLNAVAVSEYLAQVAPVPFSPEFRLGEDISAALRPYVKLGELDIRVNGAEQPIYRPHRDVIEVGDRNLDKVADLEVKELAGVDGDLAGVAWILHHGYFGALPPKTLVKGLRLRTGNVQVGDDSVLEGLFSETRFNSWAIGEVHVIDKKVLPNGRRDHFEQSVHFDNLLSQLTPTVRDIAKRCRDNSIGRKWLREFDAHKATALEKAKAIARGGLSRSSRQSFTDTIAKSIAAMRKVAGTRHIGDETRSQLVEQADATESRITKMLGGKAAATDPLSRYKPAARVAFQQIIALIHECSSTSAAANVLVDRILTRLDDSESQQSTRTQNRKEGAKGRR